MARNLTTGLQRGLRRSLRPGLGGGDLFTIASLDLIFARYKTLDPRVTFTRASSGTYVDSQGVTRTATTNEARFDHNPTTGESLGLLVEESRTNLLLRSEELDNASWSRAGLSSVTANATAAPDGNVTAESLVETTGVSEVHRVLQTISVTSGTTYSASVYFKQEGRRYGYIALGPNATWNSLGASAYIDLQTGTAQGINNCTAAIQALPNGWYRLTITATPTVTNAAASITLGSSLSGSAQIYTGDGRTAISVWGAQLEVGAFPTSYIPTTAAAVTRSADVVSIAGSNFSSWYRQDEGAVFVEYRTPASGTRGIAGFNDATSNERIALLTSGTDPKFVVVDGGVSQADLNGGTVASGVMTKSAGAYALNDFAFAHAGGTAVTDTSGTLPTTTRLLIGADQLGNYQNGRIKRLTYWPQRLSNTTLQQITQ